MSYYLDERENPDLTKTGGYREIPEDLIKSTAESLGLETIPEVKISSRIGVAQYSPRNYRIVLPRRERRTSARKTLRHEMGHAFFSHEGCKTCADEVHHELDVWLLTEGKVTGSDFGNMVYRLMNSGGLTRYQAIRVVDRIWSDRGVSSSIRTRGKKLAKQYLPKEV